MSKASGATSDPDILESAQSTPVSLNEQTLNLANLDFVPEQDQEQPQERRSSDPFLGRILANHYKIEARIGEGGMCAVYRALDLTLNRSVAIKVLLPGRLVEEGILRFQREAKTVGALDHPNIMRINELSTTEDGDPFMVMEYLEGKTLSELLNHAEGLDFVQSVKIAIQCAEALACAHAKGFVHRDVKPSNVIVIKSASGENLVKLVDFGIAHIADPSTMQLTKTGDVFGSPYYMSPEQCLGEKVDARSDIYSLGCAFYECIVKKVPFAGASALDTLRMHADEAPLPPSKINRSLRVGAEVDRIILKCLAKQPEQRYQTADALAQDLKDLLSREKNSLHAVCANLFRNLPLPNLNDRVLNKRLVVAYSTLLAGAIVWALISHGQKQFDALWDDIEVSGQQALDTGRYEKAKEQLERALQMTEFLPLSGQQSRRLATILDLKDLASVSGDAQGVENWQKEAGKIGKSVHSQHQLLTLGGADQILEAAKELERRNDIDVLEKQCKANVIVSMACDEVFYPKTPAGKRAGYFFLENVFNRVSKIIREDEEAYRRLTFDLAIFSLNCESDKFDYWMKKTRKALGENRSLSELSRAKIKADMARAYSLVGRIEEGRQCIDESMSLLRISGNTTSEAAAEVYIRKATFEKLDGNSAAASFYMGRARMISKTSQHSQRLRILLLTSEIWIASMEAPSRQSLVRCLAAIKQMESLHVRGESLARGLINTANMAQETGDLSLCNSLCLRAAAIGAESTYLLEAEALAVAGSAYARHEKTAQAKPYMVQALQILQSRNDLPPQYFPVAVDLAAVYMRQEQYAEAYDVLQEAEKRLAHAYRVNSTVKRLLYSKLISVAERQGEYRAAAMYRQKQQELGHR